MSVNINHQLEEVNNLKITPVGTGATVGTAGIVTYFGDGSQLSGISGGISSVFEDTTPRLGGDLDLNSNDITGTGNLNITGVATFSGNVTIGGTLIYDDVTNVDSIGLITARSGIKFGTSGAGGTITSAGNATFEGKAAFAGIVTAPAFTGFNYLQAPHGSTVNFTVTVAAKTAAHRYNGTGSGNGYLIDGVESPFLTFTPGRTYRFTLSSSDMTSHPFRLYLEADRTTQYTTNVTSTATYTEIVVTDTTPTVLHYQCSAHEYMGNAVQVNSNTINTPYQIDGLKGANITGVVTATTFSGSGSSLTNIPTSSLVGLATDSQLLSGIGSTSFLRSDVDTVKTNGFLKFEDTVHARFGTNGDLRLYHSGTASFIEQNGGGTGPLNIRQAIDDADVVIQSDDGSGGTTQYVRADGSNGEALLYHYGSEKLATKSNGIDVTGHTETDTLNVSGVSTFVGNVTIGTGSTVGFGSTAYFRDNAKAIFGDGNDLEIYHDGTNSYILEGGTGGLRVGSSRFLVKNPGDTKTSIDAFPAGEVQIYYDNSKKFETTNDGIIITGIATATSFVKSSNSGGFLKADGTEDTNTYLTSAASEAFKTIAVSGQSDVVADAAADTLTLVAGSNMTITTNASGDSITFASSGGGGGGTTTRSVNRYVATANQTLFPASGTISYTVGYVDVFLNGTKLDSTEFTASNGTTVTLATGATVDDIVELIAYTDVNITSVYNPWVDDAVGINTTSSVGIGTTANSTYELDVLGDIRSTGIITAANFYGDGSNLTGVSAGADILESMLFS